MFDTSKVILMNNMFKGCSKLESLQLDNFTTTQVQIMDEMFSGLINLRELHLPKFNTDTQILSSWNNIWKDITQMNLYIHVDSNKKILENKPEGINVTDITNIEELF